MKKLILAFACTFIAAFASAQHIDFGIKAGPNFSILNFDPHSNAFRAGFNAGAFIDAGFSNWSLQPGIFFTTKGETINNTAVLINGTTLGTVTTHIKLNYIEVPVNLLYHIKAGPLASFYLGGGPYFAYGISGTLQEGQTSSNINFGGKPDNSQFLNFKNPDIGATLLAGVILARKFTADIGYDYGVSDIGNGGAHMGNRVVHLSVGYLFK